jgi:hypothetical protein
MARSRLVSVKEKKELRQAILLIVITIVLLIGFIFWGLPEIARLVGNTLIKQDASGVSQGIEIKPTTPILSDIPEATSEKKLSVTGFAQPGVEIVLVVGGQQEGRVVVTDTGSFLFPDVALVEGDNLISAFAYNPASKLESEMSKEHVVIVDNTKPEITITSPANESVLRTEMERVVTISGSVNEERVKVYVGERLAIITPEKSFSVSYQLVEGDQEIVIKATDTAGNEATETLKLRWEK